jgi:hypothetical protein
MGMYNDPRNEESRELIKGVLDDVKQIATAEVTKLKAEAHEVGDSAKFAGLGLAAITIAAILFGQALAFILVAIGLPTWAGFLVAAIVMGGAGAVTVVVMKNRAVEAIKAVPVGLETRH